MTGCILSHIKTVTIESSSCTEQAVQRFSKGVYNYGAPVMLSRVPSLHDHVREVSEKGHRYTG